VSHALAINARPSRACPTTERDRVHSVTTRLLKIPQKMTLPGDGLGSLSLSLSLSRARGRGKARCKVRDRVARGDYIPVSCIAAGRGAAGGRDASRICRRSRMPVLPSSRPPHGTRNDARLRLFYHARTNNGPGNALGVSATLRALFAARTADLYPTKIDIAHWSRARAARRDSRRLFANTADPVNKARPRASRVTLASTAIATAVAPTSPNTRLIHTR